LREQSNIEIRWKRIILYGIYLLLFIPFIQNVTHLKKQIRPLDGAFYKENDIVFSWEDWFKGTYSSQKDKYIKENFGFHNYYVRAICQLNFWIFNKANAAYVVVGKDNYLYETGYIEAYYGRDFIGKQRIHNYIKKLKRVQDSLEKKNKLIVAVFAPGKAGFYPEYIPGSYRGEPKTSNYEWFIKTIQEQNVNHIDFNSYFRRQKYKSKYPLYPQLGIHWSNYGSFMAYDSMLTYFESKLGVDLPDLELKNMEINDTLKYPDDDAVNSLNLFFRPKTFKMAYPNYKVKYDSLKHTKLNLLVISDSFWWCVYSSHLPDSAFTSSRFWFYNEEMYPESHYSPTYVSQVDYASKIRKADIIMILHSEHTLTRFGGGFIDMAYETYCHPGLGKERLQRMKESIRATPEWYQQVVTKAGERNITVDSMLTIDAIYSLEQLKK